MSDAPQTAVAAAAPDLAGSIRRGTRIVFLTQIASQAVSLVVLALMMRRVAPDDYGLLGMVLPAVMLPRMAATLGLGAAVMQRELSHDELSRLFWLNLTWGMLAAATTAAGGLWLARVYEQPLAGPLCLALAGSTLLVALTNQHQALLERKLQLAGLGAARLLALACGGFAGIYSARRGAGVWALVAQQYGELVVLMLWVWMLEPWRPAWPRRGAGAAGLVRFSGAYSASQLVYYVAQNLDKLLLPLLLGPGAARAIGMYSQAFGLMLKPAHVLTAPLTGVMIAGLSQARADQAAHAALVARFFRLIAIGLFPCGVGLALVAPDLMLALGGPPWRVAGWMLAALAPALVVQGLVNAAMHVLTAAGRPGRLLGATLALCLLLVPASLTGLYLGRLHLAALTGDAASGAALGMAGAYSVVLLAWSVPFVALCLKVADVRLRDVVSPLWPAARGALLMGLVVFGLTRLPHFQSLDPQVRLGLLVAAGVAAYALLARKELAWCLRELGRAPQQPDATQQAARRE